MKIDDRRFNELAERMDALDQELDELKSGKYFEARVAYALQRILETNQAICVKHYIDGQKIETKLLRDRLKELEAKRSKVELLLKDINEQLEQK